MHYQYYISIYITRSILNYIYIYIIFFFYSNTHSMIVQELRESRGGRPGLSVLMSLLVSVDVKNY